MADEKTKGIGEIPTLFNAPENYLQKFFDESKDLAERMRARYGKIDPATYTDNLRRSEPYKELERRWYRTALYPLEASYTIPMNIGIEDLLLKKHRGKTLDEAREIERQQLDDYLAKKAAEKAEMSAIMAGVEKIPEPGERERAREEVVKQNYPIERQRMRLAEETPEYERLQSGNVFLREAGTGDILNILGWRPHDMKMLRNIVSLAGDFLSPGVGEIGLAARGAVGLTKAARLEKAALIGEGLIRAGEKGTIKSKSFGPLVDALRSSENEFKQYVGAAKDSDLLNVIDETPIEKIEEYVKNAAEAKNLVKAIGNAPDEVAKSVTSAIRKGAEGTIAEKPVSVVGSFAQKKWGAEGELEKILGDTEQAKMVAGRFEELGSAVEQARVRSIENLIQRWKEGGLTERDLIDLNAKDPKLFESFKRYVNEYRPMKSEQVEAIREFMPEAEKYIVEAETPLVRKKVSAPRSLIGAHERYEPMPVERPKMATPELEGVQKEPIISPLMKQLTPKQHTLLKTSQEEIAKGTEQLLEEGLLKPGEVTQKYIKHIMLPEAKVKKAFGNTAYEQFKKSNVIAGGVKHRKWTGTEDTTEQWLQSLKALGERKDFTDEEKTILYNMTTSWLPYDVRMSGKLPSIQKMRLGGPEYVKSLNLPKDIEGNVLEMMKKPEVQNAMLKVKDDLYTLSSRAIPENIKGIPFYDKNYEKSVALSVSDAAAKVELKKGLDAMVELNKDKSLKGDFVVRMTPKPAVVKEGIGVEKAVQPPDGWLPVFAEPLADGSNYYVPQSIHNLLSGFEKYIEVGNKENALMKILDIGKNIAQEFKISALYGIYGGSTMIANTIGNILVGMTKGINPQSYVDAINAMRGKFKINTVEGNELSGRWLYDELASRGALGHHSTYGQSTLSPDFMSRFSGKPWRRMVIDAIGPLPSKNIVSKGMMKANEISEYITRMGAAIDQLKKGNTLDGAAKYVKDNFFDYADLSKAERSIRDFFVPFYTFFRFAAWQNLRPEFLVQMFRAERARKEFNIRNDAYLKRLDPALPDNLKGYQTLLWSDEQTGNIRSFDPSRYMTFLQNPVVNIIRDQFENKNVATQGMLGSLYPWMRQAVEAGLTEYRIRTGQKKRESRPTSFLGVEMEENVRDALSYYPFLQQIDRLNPFGLFNPGAGKKALLGLGAYQIFEATPPMVRLGQLALSRVYDTGMAKIAYNFNSDIENRAYSIKQKIDQWVQDAIDRKGSTKYWYDIKTASKKMERIYGDNIFVMETFIRRMENSLGMHKKIINSDQPESVKKQAFGNIPKLENAINKMKDEYGEILGKYDKWKYMNKNTDNAFKYYDVYNNEFAGGRFGQK